MADSEKKIDRSDLVAAVGINYPPKDKRLEVGDKIPAEMSEDVLRKLKNGGAVVTKTGLKRILKNEQEN